jgi:hypothetical protein
LIYPPELEVKYNMDNTILLLLLHNGFI